MVLNLSIQPHPLLNNRFFQKDFSLKEEGRDFYSLEKKNASIEKKDTAAKIDAAGPVMNLAEKQVIDRLKSADAAVRAHEQAHIAAAGGVATGGPSYVYLRGPDGRLYAVGGEVAISTASVPGNPEATIKKAQQLRRAALAPANPSAQDLQVAAEATRMEQEARAELAKQEREEKSGEEKAGKGDVISLDTIRPDNMAELKKDELYPRFDRSVWYRENKDTDDTSQLINLYV